MKRVLLFLAAVAVCVVGYVFLLSLMRGSPWDVGSVAAALFLATSLWALNRKFFRWEGRSLAEIGFDAPRLRVREFAMAFLGGCGVVALWVAALWAIVSPEWRSYAGFNAAGGASRIAFCLFNNTGEELAYRGYLIKKLDERFGKWTAVLATSILFAILHVQGGVPWLSAATIVFTSGILYAVMLLRWNSLPLVAGFHVATNVAQELLGLRVTGLTLIRPVFGNASSVRQIAPLVAVAVINLVIASLLLKRVRANL